MRISQRAQSIKASPSSQASQRARELKASGVDLISLTVGEPDFDTPEHITEAAFAATRAGKTRYTDTGGVPELKDAICRKLQQENNLDYARKNVIASTGAKQAIFNALYAIVDEGDEVIIPAPYWVSYPDMVKLVGGTPVIVETDANTGFKLSAQQIRDAITPRTRCVIINSPSNPTGAVYSRAEMQALIDVLKPHEQVLVVSDEVYEHILFDDRTFTSFASVDASFKDRVITINAVSKTYAMTGWRLGYAAGHEDIVKAMNKVQSQSTSCPSSIGQQGALAALNSDQSCRHRFVQEYAQRRDYVMQRISEIPGITCVSPDGAFYAFISCQGVVGQKSASGRVIRDGMDFSEHLIDHGVFLIPGEAYGTPNHARLSFATSLEELRSGMDRIQKAVLELH
ncbi:pyridoxal phosphate-dependent aminotransferase [Diaphorobacter sp.]|uniref:pyridoxal phosphate-dependent aminotransferase n=1 Tax=Diaphorobacter sp. TaxID=1934310 RepID=UPI0028A9DE67|nr:pyridoxal phosphate-dependent aminotransferase [Diaphorobacter sp.]